MNLFNHKFTKQMKTVNKPPAIAYLFLLFVYLINANQIEAQKFDPGYIIQLDGERIEGGIKYTDEDKRSEACTFWYDGAEKEYAPGEIKAYGLATGYYYESNILPDLFTQVLFKGAINLYQKDEIFLVQKGDGPILPLLPTQKSIQINGKTYSRTEATWRACLVSLTEDCFDRANDLIRPLSLNQKDLTKILRVYSNCTEEPAQLYSISIPKTKVQIGLIAGGAMSFLNTNPRGDNLFSNLIEETYQSGNLHGGLSINWSSPRFSQNWSLQTEAIYQRLSFHSSFLNQTSTLEDWVEINVDIQSISLPILLQYQQRIVANRWFVQGGVSLDQHFSSRTERIRELVDQNTVNTQLEQLFEVEASQLSLMFRIGILAQIKDIPIGCSLAYQNIPQLNTDESLGLKGHRFQLNLITIIK